MNVGHVKLMTWPISLHMKVTLKWELFQGKGDILKHKTCRHLRAIFVRLFSFLTAFCADFWCSSFKQRTHRIITFRMFQSFEIQMFKKVHGHSEAFLQNLSEALWKTKTQKIPLIVLPEFLKPQQQAAVRAYSRFRTQFSTNGTFFYPSCCIRFLKAVPASQYSLQPS